MNFTRGTQDKVKNTLKQAYEKGTTVSVYLGNRSTGEDSLTRTQRGVLYLDKQSNSLRVMGTDYNNSDSIDTSSIVRIAVEDDTIPNYEHPCYHKPTIEVSFLLDGTITLKTGDKIIGSSLTTERALDLFKGLTS